MIFLRRIAGLGVFLASMSAVGILSGIEPTPRVIVLGMVMLVGLGMVLWAILRWSWDDVHAPEGDPSVMTPIYRAVDELIARKPSPARAMRTGLAKRTEVSQ